MTQRPSTAAPCVDCSVPVIGGEVRCPACRWKHAASRKPLLTAQAVAAWLAISLNVVIVAALLIFAGRNCQ